MVTDFKIFQILLSLIFIGSGHSKTIYDLYNELELPIRLPSIFQILNASVNGPCGRQLEILQTSHPFVLLQMFDSSGKIPSGLLRGNAFELGNFDECYNIKRETPDDVIYGKYCLSTVPVYTMTMNPPDKSTDNDTDSRRLGTPVELIGLHIGYCVPNKCTAENLTKLTSGLINFTENYCYSKDTEPEFDYAAIITMTILSLFLCLVLIATLYNLYFHYLQKGATNKVLMAFSAYYNGENLFSPSSDPNQLLCLNGIRAISTMWILLTHIYLNSTMGPLFSFADLYDWMQDKVNMFMLSSSLSVDTFFTIGGLLVTYGFLRTAEKGEKFNVISYYVHRYIRLTPPMAVMVIIHVTLIPYMGIGPTWNGVQDYLVNECKEFWWSALLHVQNFNPDGKSCVPQSWYLSVDFQLFLLSPIVLIPLKNNAKHGITLMLFLIVLGIISPFVITYIYETPAFITNFRIADVNVMKLYYKQTHTRFGPYVIGMLCGYFVYKLRRSDRKIRLDFGFILIIWALTIGGLLTCVYAGHDVAIGKYDVWSNSAVNGFMRNAWALGICSLTFMCIAGYGGCVNWFLSLPVFQILSKLSYCIYLVHYCVITMRYAASKVPYRFSNSGFLWSFWADFMVTLFFSLILSLTFEFPILRLEKIFQPERKETTRTRVQNAEP